MKVESTDLDRALAMARRMVEDQDCRCATCSRLLEPGSEAVLLPGPGPLFRREVTELRLDCTHCKTRNPLTWGFEQELAGQLGAAKGQAGRETPDTCPECGARMEPDGGCFFCRSCGYSQCG